MRLVLLGPPGAGKGTLASFLKESLNILHISTGDILREEMKKGSPIGQEAKQYVESGQLVPDEVVTRLIEHKFATDNSIEQGYMLDGFPRTKAQAQDLDVILEKVNQPLDCALYLESSLEVIIQRLTGRRICRNCGDIYHTMNKPPKVDGVCDSCSGELYQRPDDNEETIRKRMDVYFESTTPIIEYYKEQGKLKTVDSDKEAQEVRDASMKILDEYRK